MSRNTQGGLGHRLRGRRGGNARHRHQLSSSGGGSRTGEMERREKKEKGANWVGRGFSLVTPQSSRARRMRRAEAGDNQGEKKNGNTAARVEPESVGRRCQRRQYLYPEGGARRRHRRPVCRATGAGSVPPGNVGGAEEEGQPCAVRGRRAGPLGLAGAGQALASRPRAACRSPAGG